ncbi:MAG: CDP-alcohol phosphatidyltransferase family protein [Chloroflexi bacterium]|nr:CDP-alcohol phosphatidyltransferase family protein [Chloroflexota bacterium]
MPRDWPRWGIASVLLVVGMALWVAWAAPQAILCWALIAALGTGYVWAYTWRYVAENRPAAAAPRYTRLGWANGLTVLRGVLLAMMAGFLCPAARTPALAWAPAGLYGLNAWIDGVDGLIARRSGHASLLGRRLDLHFDAWGVFLAAALAVLWDRLPAAFLLVALARYLYVALLALAARLGWLTRAVPHDPLRRALAGLMMGFLAVALAPVFPAAALAWVGWFFLVPFLLGFARDAAYALHLSPRFGPLTEVWPRLAPVARLVAAGMLVLRLPEQPWAWRAAGLVLAAALALGVLPRLVSLAMLFGIGFGWMAGWWGPTAWTALVVLALTIVVLGGGGASALWPADEPLFTQRLGRPRSAAWSAARPQG